MRFLNEQDKPGEDKLTWVRPTSLFTWILFLVSCLYTCIWKPRVEDIVADKPLLTMSSFQPLRTAATDGRPAQPLVLPRQSARWSSAPWAGAGVDGGSVCSVVFIAVFPFIHFWEQPPSPRRCPSPPAAPSLSMWSGHSDVKEGEGGPARWSYTKISAPA